MNVLLLLLFALLAPFLFWSWSRRARSGEIKAADSASGLSPTAVTLPDEDEETGERPERRRTGETQKLERKVVHGPYRPVGDRGAPSEVRRLKQP